MLTTHPSIMLGSYKWEEDSLPSDEFDIRLAILRQAMQQRGWSAAMVYGDAREHSALAFFTNFIPRMRWAMAILPHEGEPRLLASMSSRDMPAMQTMTWIQDVKSGWEWQWCEASMRSLRHSGKIGAIGFDLMTPTLHQKIQNTIAVRHSLEPADDVTSTARIRHRPRELAIIQTAANIVAAAAKAIKSAWREGNDIETAALSGERIARRMAAQDVRTLVSRDGGKTLEPYRARFTDRPERLLAYVAVKYMGYWGELFVGDDEDALHAQACRTLQKALNAFAVTLSIAELERRVGEKLLATTPILGEALGHRIGLSSNEGDSLDADARPRPNIVYTLRTAAVDDAGRAGISSAMIVMSETGELRILTRSE